MLVLDQKEFQEKAEFLEPVSDLGDKEDVATLLDCWNHALSNEGVSWLKVTSVYRGEDNFFYFITGMPSESFNLFQFIEQNGGPELSTLTARKVVGAGRGAPKVAVGPAPKPIAPPVVPPQPPVSAPVEAIPPRPEFSPAHYGESEIAPEDEDDISTGFLDEDLDDSSGFDETPAYTGKVFILTVDRIGQEIEVGPTPVRIGRGTQSEVQLQGNVRLSRVHAMFEVRDDILYVQDMDSSNGTYLNGFALADERPVQVGDEVNLGGETVSVSELQ